MSDAESTVAKGTAYELLVREIHQAILAAEGLEHVEVQHNTTLKGRSGCDHQIDVYWEFKVAGQTYRTAIECKAFDKTVSVGRVRDFYGVLVDVPGLKGVFATLVGYQAGARKFGEHYGVSLLELRPPTEADWDGRVRNIHVQIHIVIPTITGFNPRFTSSGIARLREVCPDNQLQMSTWTDRPLIFTPAGEPVASYEELRQGLPTDGTQAQGLNHFAAYSGYILRTEKADLEIDGIDLEYDVQVETQPMTIAGDELVKAIVKDVTSGEVTFVDKGFRARTDGCTPR